MSEWTLNPVYDDEQFNAFASYFWEIAAKAHKLLAEEELMAANS